MKRCHTGFQYSSEQGFSFLSSLVFVIRYWFFMTAILTDVKLYHILLLICIFLMISDLEYLFIYLLVICMSSLEKCLFGSIIHFLIWLFFCYWFLMCFLCILDINALLGVCFANIFSYSTGCIFIWLMVSFTEQKLWFDVIPFVKKPLLSVKSEKKKQKNNHCQNQC